MCAALASCQGTPEGLLLDFPRTRRQPPASGGVGQPRLSAPAAPSRHPAQFEEWEHACTLLRESIERAWERLDDHPCQAAEAVHLRHTLSAARQLLAKPGTQTVDLLNYLADVEAGIQMLAAPARAASSSASSLARRPTPEPDGPAADTQVADIAGRSGASSSSFPAVVGHPPQSADARRGSHLLAMAGAISAPDVVEGSSVADRKLQLQVWNDAADRQAEVDRICRLDNILNEVRTVADLQQQVAELADSHGSVMDSVEEQCAKATEETAQAGRELGAAAKTKARGWTLKGSLGGAALGAAVGACVAGPIGATIGAGVSATVGGSLGKAAKRAHNTQVDTAVANLQQPRQQQCTS